MRASNAHEIWNVGASNPRGVSRALTEAIDEATAEGGGSDAAKDPSVQMILDHLCFLCGLPQPSLAMEPGEWDKIQEHVRSQAAVEKAAKPAVTAEPKATPLEKRKFRCPTSATMASGAPHTLVGCGEEFESFSDGEGLIDCPHCGLWFRPNDEEEKQP